MTVLSAAQEGLWLAEIATPGTATYNLPLAIDWTGTVDTGALAHALRTVVDRHDPLRTTYDFVDGEPVAVVAERVPVPLDVVDLDDVPDPPKAAVADALSRAAAPFDLATDLPLRCVVWRRPPDGDLVLLCVHHIAADGWGMSVLLDELARTYTATVRGDRVELAELRECYADAAVRERSEFEQAPATRAVAERAAQLVPHADDFDLDGPAAPAVRQPRRGAQLDFAMPDALWSAVTRLAQSLHTTPFVVLLAAFQVVVARRAGRSEFLLGTAMANRPHIPTHDLVGCFVNMVPLRCSVTPQWTFEELCRRTGDETLTALEYQHIPFRRLVVATGRHGGRGSAPLVQIAFGVQATSDHPAPWRRARYLPTGTAKFDLNVLLEYGAAGLAGTVEYDLDRCPEPAVRRICDDLLRVLTAATGAPRTPLGHLPAGAGENGELE